MSDANRAYLILTDESKYSVEIADWARRANRKGMKWVTRQLTCHTHPPGRPCIILLEGARVVFSAIQVGERYECLLTFGAGRPEVSRDGFEIYVEFREDGTVQTTKLLRETIQCYDPDNPWVERRLDLAPLVNKRGEFIVACDPGVEMNCRGDLLALYEFVVSPAKELTLNRARAFATLREKNELTVFSNVYRHAIYNKGIHIPSWALLDIKMKTLLYKARIGGTTYLFKQISGHFLRLLDQVRRSSLVEVIKQKFTSGEAKLVPNSKLNLFEYCTSRLRQELKIQNINFRNYLESKLKTHQNRPIRILSLASGAARIEEEIIHQ